MRLTYLVLVEPQLVEVDAKSYVEIVFLDERIGSSLTVLPFKAEVDDGFRAGSRQTETASHAIFFK
jgi:hypothetical protein